MVMLTDRRRHARNPIDWPVSIYYPHLGMFINGRSVDVSKGGAKIRLPLAAPIRPGQIVELNFPRTTTLAKVAGCFSRIKTAWVVRVEAGSQEDGAPSGPASSAESIHSSGGFEGLSGPAVLTAPAAAKKRVRRPKRQFVAVRFDRNALAKLSH